MLDKAGLMNASRYHHHQVPSTCSRSAIMDLQDLPLFLHIYPLWVCPNHSLMFFIQVILSLSRSLFPSILPSSNNFWIDLALITCPKYWHFLFFIVVNNELAVFTILKTSSSVLCSVHDTLNILLYAHISKASPYISLISFILLLFLADDEIVTFAQTKATLERFWIIE